MGNRLAPAPQPLPEDSIYDILLRLPPDDPAGIIRASAVCKAWCSIITNPAFLGQYRALHPRAPVLGFLHRPRNDELLPRFVPTTSFRPAAADHRQHPLECRHGRAVVFDYGSIGNYIVYDPVTGELHKLPQVPGGDYLPQTAVVCVAGGGCDHRGCNEGPFIVAFVGLVFGYSDDEVYDDETTDHGEDEEDDDEDEDGSVYVHACYYESDTGEMTGYMYVEISGGRSYLDDRPAALVGDSLYFLCRPWILQYRYGLLRHLGGTMGMKSAGVREHDMVSRMELPRWEHLGIGKKTDVVIMEAEGGGLGLACLCPKTRTMLYLLAREIEDTVRDDGWVQRRVIDLKMLLPIGNNPEWKPCLCGIAQDVNVIFIRTEDGVFSTDLRSSLKVRKVCEMGVVHNWIYPFESFYTESLLLKLASSKLPAPVGNQ